MRAVSELPTQHQSQIARTSIAVLDKPWTATIIILLQNSYFTPSLENGSSNVINANDQPLVLRRIILKNQNAFSAITGTLILKIPSIFFPAYGGVTQKHSQECWPEYQDGKDSNVQQQLAQEAVLLVDQSIARQAVHHPCQCIPYHRSTSIQFLCLRHCQPCQQTSSRALAMWPGTGGLRDATHVWLFLLW